MKSQAEMNHSTTGPSLCLLLAAAMTAVASGAPSATVTPHPDTYQIGTGIELRATITPGGDAVSRVEFFAGTVSLGDGRPVWDGRWEFPDGAALGIMDGGQMVDYDPPNGSGMFAMGGNLTTPSTFEGTFMHWPAEGGEATGAATVLLSWTGDGTLNANISGDDPLGARMLTGGVGANGNPYAMTWSGAPAGIHSITAKLHYGTGQSVVSAPTPVTVEGAAGPAPVISSSTILNGIVGQPLSYAIRTSGASTSYAASGLPTGLVCAPESGIITGVPETSGISVASLVATGTGGTATLNLTINISAVETTILNIGNIYAVSSNPTQPTTFTLASATKITFIEDYHYFNGGVLPGTIALRHDNGTVYGPWQTAGRIGQGGVANAYWSAWPMAVLPAGTYTVVDSSPSTWSHNYSSGYRGFTIVKGIANSPDAGALLATWTAACGLVGAAADLEADPDGDGRPTWLEAALGGHPMRADPTPVGMRATMLGARHAVSYLACSGGSGVPGSDHVVNGTRIVTEVSSSLGSGSWEPAVKLLDVADAVRIDNGDGTETVVIPLRTPAGSGSPVFVREYLSRLTEP